MEKDVEKEISAKSQISSNENFKNGILSSLNLVSDDYSKIVEMGLSAGVRKFFIMNDSKHQLVRKYCGDLLTLFKMVKYVILEKNGGKDKNFLVLENLEFQRKKYDLMTLFQLDDYLRQNIHKLKITNILTDQRENF